MSTYDSTRRDIVPVGKYALAGWAFLLMRYGFIFGIIGLIYILIHRGEVEKMILWTSVSLLVVAALASIKVLGSSRSVTCPLCRAPLLMGSRNLVKPRTRHFCGSSKTPVAFTLARGGKILACPYCAERVRLRR